ncbi:hypothetical protein PCASD_08841 [Puccinia coronata f. sp. avenae]|uniref:Uncharacterized protein n=1 Tax=Puccinia coronata f. sp. avenae TaxID=200324 RepID=A0A2N5URV7_9BASI|nr:hypothetical protein PCASD_08841 [Puccinia coronata f. sp. avenae]
MIALGLLMPLVISRVHPLPSPPPPPPAGNLDQWKIRHTPGCTPPRKLIQGGRSLEKCQFNGCDKYF